MRRIELLALDNHFGVLAVEIGDAVLKPLGLNQIFNCGLALHQLCGLERLRSCACLFLRAQISLFEQPGKGLGRRISGFLLFEAGVGKIVVVGVDKLRLPIGCLGTSGVSTEYVGNPERVVAVGKLPV